MKKFALLIILVILSVAVGLNWQGKKSEKQEEAYQKQQKTAILKFALVADSENENDLLTKALTQAQGMGINFVIGLGDYTNVGTIEELEAAKKVFDKSKLQYFLTAGDHDLWDSRNRGEEALVNYRQVLGSPSQKFEKNGVQFVILDNSDIYKGIDDKDWQMLGKSIAGPAERFPRSTSSFQTDSSVVSTNNSDAAGAQRGSPALVTRDGTTHQLTFVFAHKTPFHPQSSHVMGEDSSAVSDQAKRLLKLLEDNNVDGFFSGDLHFFAQFKSPGDTVKITTVGAVSSERNFQGPRFVTVTVFNDYSWKVEDVEIR